MKYAITFLLLAIFTSTLAFMISGVGHLLHWYTVSFFALVLAYMGIGRIFAKQEDGRLPLWSKVVHMPYLGYYSIVWHIMRTLSRENPTDPVTETLMLGRRLSVGEAPDGIVNYVDLTSELEDPVEMRRMPGYVCLPILDAHVPNPDDLRTVINRLNPGLTFVHCAQGHGRAGVFAMALLAHRGEISSFEEGLALLKSARPGVILNRTQETFVRRYIGRLETTTTTDAVAA